jgi:hypothetical protein
MDSDCCGGSAAGIYCIDGYCAADQLQ